FYHVFLVFFFQAEDGIRDFHVTGVQTCALPISSRVRGAGPCRAAGARYRRRRAPRRGAEGRRARRDRGGGAGPFAESGGERDPYIVLWGESVAVLGLGVDELWRLTPREYAAIRDAWRRDRDERESRADYRAAVLVATAYNAAGGKKGGGVFEPHEFFGWFPTL